MFVYASGLGRILEILEKHGESKPITLEIEARFCLTNLLAQADVARVK